MESVSKTQEKFLDIGKKEFLKNGFSNTSLRDIVKKAGFTLGAFYGYYPNKEALFNALVEKPAKEFLDYHRNMRQVFMGLTIDQQKKFLGDASHDGIMWSIDYMYQYFDVFKLILGCSAGTRYENYIDEIVEIEVESTYWFIDNFKSEERIDLLIDEDLVHILASAMLNGVFEVIVHNMTKERAIAYVQALEEFFLAGWQKILGL